MSDSITLTLSQAELLTKLIASTYKSDTSYIEAVENGEFEGSEYSVKFRTKRIAQCEQLLTEVLGFKPHQIKAFM